MSQSDKNLVWLAMIYAERDRVSFVQAYEGMEDEPACQEALEFLARLRDYKRRHSRTIESRPMSETNEQQSSESMTGNCSNALSADINDKTKDIESLRDRETCPYQWSWYDGFSSGLKWVDVRLYQPVKAYAVFTEHNRRGDEMRGVFLNKSDAVCLKHFFDENQNGWENYSGGRIEEIELFTELKDFLKVV